MRDLIRKGVFLALADAVFERNKVKRDYLCEISKAELTPDLTIPKLFLQKTKQYGSSRVAMREKEFGVWRPITWAEYYDRVKFIALGLIELGLSKGDKVALIGVNRPEGLWTEMAALCAGGIAVWLFQDCLLDEVQYILDHSDAKFLICEGQEEVDKGLSVLDKCPKLEKIIWDDPKGMRGYDAELLTSLDEVVRLGKDLDGREPQLFEHLIAEGEGNQVALLFYTSGMR